MKLGILETGGPPPALADRFTTYPAMFGDLLGDAYDYLVFDARAGQGPAHSDACDAYLITGSAAGVYDGAAWIDALKRFVAVAAGRRPLIGVCFGHQLMAEALGGEVRKSDKGWGIGLHDYEVVDAPVWMRPPGGRVAVVASHQDQVVTPPPSAKLVGRSAFTPYAILDYPGLRAMSLQPHPEFDPSYAEALIRLRRGAAFDAGLADTALATLGRPNDRRQVGGWLRAFLAGETS